jgi:Tfp pilus assembly protein PilO
MNLKDTTALNTNLQAIRNIVLNFIVPLVCVGIAVCLGAFVLYPSYKAQPELKLQIASSRALQSQLDTKLSNLRKVVDYNSVILENSTLVNKVLVDYASIPQLLTQLDMIARESGLEVSRLGNSGASGTPVVGDIPYSEVTVGMSVNGTYEQFVSFLETLETSARLVLITDFRFGSDTSGEDSVGKLGVSLILNAPYLKVQSSAVTDDPVNLDISSRPFLDLVAKLKSFKYYDIEVYEGSDADTSNVTDSEVAPEASSSEGSSTF